ncbi:hypothetical protein SAMN04488030_2029 [Aliiroseovarius halocynthiae]|uniref:DUF4386 family protein n=1 Tax=Aliiroseovarius halocynthiae TaxID=985055 RepID=A0A545SRD4_9RHOB|nr:hypothetical protein [Aliiroseovarius halocynthiae]TQV67545.1 hypothetical protein FIL88_10010 [Aliiroseovarius halocynthiae]SMR81559.1 hypothetical protein SAMN04488030_2029 [Aliiroseovarius halocynthiae]
MNQTASNLPRLGSIAAFICAATYIYGFAVFLAVLEPAGFSAPETNAEQLIAILTQNAALISSWYLIIYVLNAIALTVLVVALYATSHATQPDLAKLSGAFGLIWCVLILGAGMMANVGLSTTLGIEDPVEAARMWRVVTTVENGIGGGNEIAGGVWIIVTSLAARAFISPALRWTGIVIGACGLMTMIPLLEPAGMVFGLGFIAWFVWMGFALRRI